MYFDHVKSSFQPEQLAGLTDAFDLAWPAIMFVRDIVDEQLELELRTRLANYIIAVASSKQTFDPIVLSHQALKAFCRQKKLPGGFGNLVGSVVFDNVMEQKS